MGFVYFITDGTKIKIGYSKNVKSRIKQLNTGNSCKLYLLGYIQGDKELEKHLHRKFKCVNLEWFQASDELLEFINNNNVQDRYIDWNNGKLISYLRIKK